jgi:hypothetical protein
MKGEYKMIKHAGCLYQPTLFRRTLDEFLEETKLDLTTLKKLYELKLLSFDADKLNEFDAKEITEAKFIKALFYSGLIMEKILFMLGKLEKPYCYSFEEIYWDFEKEEWVSIDDLVFKELENYRQEIFEELIEDKELFEEALNNFIDAKREEEDVDKYLAYNLGDYIVLKKYDE